MYLINGGGGRRSSLTRFFPPSEALRKEKTSYSDWKCSLSASAGTGTILDGSKNLAPDPGQSRGVFQTPGPPPGPPCQGKESTLDGLTCRLLSWRPAAEQLVPLQSHLPRFIHSCPPKEENQFPTRCVASSCSHFRNILWELNNLFRSQRYCNCPEGALPALSLNQIGPSLGDLGSAPCRGCTLGLGSPNPRPGARRDP